MRRGASQLVSALVVFVACTAALATEVRKPLPQDSAAPPPEITSVTDAQGNPIPLRPNAAGSTNPGETRTQAQEVQRGQAWWPYASSLPPYTSVNRRLEAMADDEIQVNGVASFSVRDPEATLKLIPADLKLAAGSQDAQKDGYYLVKIAGRTRTQEQIDALTRAGAVLGEYLNVNTYFAKIPSISLKAVKSLPFVTYLGDYHPAYKISPRIGLESIPVTETIDAAGRAKPWLFEVTLHKGADLQAALDNFAKIGIFPGKTDIVANDELTTVYVATTPETVLSIALLPEVKFIAEKTYAQLLASATNPAALPMVLQNNGTYTTNTALGWKLWNAGIDGSATNQIVTMMDSGLNTKMEHFSQDILSNGTVGASHRKVVGYDVYGGDQCVLDSTSSDGGHGTKTSQHAVGSISNMATNPDTTHTPTINYDNGIARGGKVYFQDCGLSTGSIAPPADLGPSITAAIAKGSFVQNNSWGTSTDSYDAEASNLDTALFNNPNFVVTVSSGNRGATGTSTLGSPGTAKNIISVGGNDVANPNNLFIDCSWDGTAACASTDLGSSRGPVTGSGRVKPDIMSYIYSSSAVGGESMAVDQPTAMCQTDATKTVYWNYVNSGLEGGTSFAAPDVAGVALLVRDYFMQGFYPSGTATPANVITPSGSLVKAVILASGEAMATTSFPTSSAINARYSSDVGYGRVNVPGVLHIGSSAPFLWVQNNDTLGQSSTKSFFYNINGNAIPLRVMMVYYDAAGDALQKDADLKVTIGANVYLGNVMSGSWSTTGGTADHTNNTEGVFLDSAHGLPASGQVRVDVTGFNNPGGMNYSLVVTGNVTSTAVTQVSLDKGQYTCASTINVTVNDAAASSPVSVTLTSKDSLSTVIDTKVVSCAGSGGVFNGSIVAGSGITVANGGSITATYSTATPATATIACQAAVGNGGFLIQGGCDNTVAGTVATGPLTNGGSNEFYNKYMDANEYTSYKFSFVNNTGSALSDAYVALSFSGAGSSFMTAFNGPIHVGYVAAGATAGGVFQLYTSPSAPGLTSVNLDFDLTSPADGYTTATRITQVQFLQANDQIARQNRCSQFSGPTLSPWVESAVNGHATNPWKWSGSATTPATVSSENRTDGMCGSTTVNAAAMIGNSAITSGNNFTANADSVLLQSFQPNLRGNGPNGQPYHYAWAWHSFYHASETLGATTGVWGIFYNDAWNSATAPTGAQVTAFTNKLAYYYQTIFDYLGTWNWETANTGTPDNPDLNSTTIPIAAPNQLIITFGNVTGLATASTYFAYGHEHADVTVFGGTSTATTRRDIAFDNDNLVYDEYYTVAQAAACGAGTQVGQVSFDQVSYGTCPTGPAVISVLDGNGVSGMTVTVTSPGTGDSEVVTLTGSAPYFSGTLNLSTVTGVGANNGTLFVLPTETISATYTDASPAGSSTATATTACVGGNVIYVSNAQILDNGDNDGIADNNETVTIDIAIQNNLATALTNAKVQIFSASPNIDCISDPQALYGTVAAGATVTNPTSDRFKFHVASSVACSDPANPPTATFTVVITGDGLNGSSSAQTFTINLDRNVGAGTTSYTQSFATNPGWSVGVTAPDNTGCTANTYTNDFHWCAACGNGGGGYGAWIGNAAFGTSGQEYTAAYASSTLYSPVFTAGGTSVGMQFRVAFRTEATAANVPYDGGIVQYQLAGGAWTTLAYNTPAQQATTSSNFCSPILLSSAAWGGTTVSGWTLTDTPTVATTNGQSIQFRWRMGGDGSGVPTTYGGFGVDDVTVTGLRAFVCEPNRNALAGCGFCSTQPNGTACDDGSACTTGDVCSNGNCVGTTITCNDGNVCTTDACNPASGCVFTNNTAACNDGNACTSGDVCSNGTCAGTTITCNDGNVCTTDTCNPASGCVFTNNTNTCNDSSACTTGDVCSNGTCSGTAITCNDGNVCTTDTCNPASGCVFTNNTAACDDLNACTSGDVCGNGTCAGTTITCNDGNVCTTDTCNPASGCVYTNNSNACSDGNACTTGDTCSGGTCQPGTGSLNCNDGNPCTDDSCSPTSGCVHTNNTAPCSDGNACTTGDVCSAGSCLPGSPLVCNDNNVCTTDSCNPFTGCKFTNNTASCDDGNPCTTGDVCSGGSCQPGAGTLNCNDNNPCTDDSCSPTSGCVHDGNTASCSDGNACTVGDVCSGGSCQPGTAALDCNDNNPCTDDSCNPTSGCVHDNNTAPCTDGNACTTGDTCSGGICLPGTGTLNCDDGNVCTDDSCNPTSGCVHANNTNPCNDNNECTTNDQCNGQGVCVGGSGPNCDDGNPCTTDSCTVATGCTHVNNNAPCSDGNACTTGDTCSAGICQPGTGTLDCNEGNPCTDDSCNPTSGCGHANNTASCSDGNPCTLGDTCGGGICQPGTGSLNCNDNNPCTDDSCNPTSGCAHANNTASCSDGNACTTGDTCSGGVCQPGTGSLICNDNNVCTTDSCNPGTGCVFANNTGACDDFNPCTIGDTCGGGVCNAGTTITAPAEIHNVAVAADKVTYSWSSTTFAAQYDVVRGSIAAFPVGPGGGDETCFDNLAAASLVDAATPPPGAGFWYLSRGQNACGTGTFGTQSNGAPRVTTTCP